MPERWSTLEPGPYSAVAFLYPGTSPHFGRFAYADDDDDDDAARLRARSPIFKARVCSGGSDGNRREGRRCSKYGCDARLGKAQSWLTFVCMTSACIIIDLSAVPVPVPRVDWGLGKILFQDFVSISCSYPQNVLYTALVSPFSF